jgi:dTDP-4-amino-4,6-dideoxygalactose transaminase
MITTNSEALYRTLVRLRTHGITRDPRFMGSVPEGAWYYEQVDLGLNYRMTDIQAALGTSQLRRLDKFVARRSELADRYDQRLSMFPLSLPARISGTNSAWHLYVVRLDTEKMNKTRGEVFDALKRRGIGVNVHYIPVHTQPYFRGLGFRKGQFPEAERYYEEALTLPLYPLMSDSEQDFVVSQLKEVIA